MPSNYIIIIDRVEHHEICVSHLFRDLLTGPNSTNNRFNKVTNVD